MNYKTACNFLLEQGTALVTRQKSDALLMLLKQGKPPIPGQMTSLLLALKIVFDTVQDTQTLDRQLIYALHLLSFESQQLFIAGQQSGVTWPPLLKEDLHRIEVGVRSIFSGEWQG